MVKYQENQNDLPVPKNEWQQEELIDEIEHALELLNEPYATQIENKDHLMLGSELLECLNPSTLDDLSLSDEWKSDTKIWLFKNEIMRIIRTYDDDHPKRKFFKEVCENYLDLLSHWNKTWKNLPGSVAAEQPNPLTKGKPLARGKPLTKEKPLAKEAESQKQPQKKIDQLLVKLAESI